MHRPDDHGLMPGRTASGRHVAPGGWRRSVVGVLVGVVAGALALVTMRSTDDPALPPDHPDDDTGVDPGADTDDRQPTRPGPDA